MDSSLESNQSIGSLQVTLELTLGCDKMFPKLAYFFRDDPVLLQETITVGNAEGEPKNKENTQKPEGEFIKLLSKSQLNLNLT